MAQRIHYSHWDTGAKLYAYIDNWAWQPGMERIRIEGALFVMTNVDSIDGMFNIPLKLEEKTVTLETGMVISMFFGSKDGPSYDELFGGGG